MSVTLNPGSGGASVDSATVSGSERQIAVIGGDGAAAEKVDVTNTTPGGSDYGLVVRPIPSGTQAVSDGGGSLTVDGTVGVSGSVTVTDGSGALSVDDNGGSLTVDDGGGSLTVDGTVSVSGAVDTELPAAAALADGASNPTTPTVGASNLMWNGTTWDRARGDTTNGIDVDVTRVSGNVTVVDGGGTLSIDDGAGSITVDGTVAVSGNVTVVGAAADGGAASGNPVQVAGKDGSGNIQAVLTDTAGRIQVSLSRPWTNTGSYRAVTALLSVQASADAATAGRWWLINPVGSSVGVAVLRVVAYFTFLTEIDMITAPRVTLERVTFTGTASGATLTPSKRVRTTVQGQAGDANAVGSVRTASTGMSLSAGEVEHAFLAPTMGLTTSGIGVSQPPMNIYGLSERGEDALILAPGEGLVCRQPDAGTTSDGRRFVTTIEWEEFTT